jgi:hypothetical protein
MTLPTTSTSTPVSPADPDVQRALAIARRLWLACALVSVVGLAITTVLSITDPHDVTWVVWLRGSVVAVAGFVLMAVTAAAARGSRAAYVRLRWISILAPIGVIAIVLAPDAGYPLWMKIEQVVIGVLIALIAVQLNRSSVRRAFSRSVS